MKRSISAILLLMSFLLALSHEIIPHHHHDETENKASFHLEKSSHSHHDHTGHDHDHDDNDCSKPHPFPNHQHISVAGDFNFIRLGNNRLYEKDHAYKDNTIGQQRLVFTFSVYQSNKERRWCIPKAVINPYSFLIGAFSLRGPPYLV